jgi:hypothetical protein
MPKSWKTDRSGTNEASRSFDLFAQPFRILRVDPAATHQQVDEAFDIARQQRLASNYELVGARESIFDPSRRLLHELTYPIDSPRADVDALYAMLSSDAPMSELLLFAERLAPLSRANYVAHIVANRPAESALLRVLVEAHADIEPMEIYEILKVLRKTGENPTPSLASVNEGLQHLLAIHAQAAIAGFKGSEDSIEPVLACTQQILGLGNRHQIDAISSLLAAYHQAICQQQSVRVQEIKSACQVLQIQPTVTSSLEALNKALAGWASLCRPLILFDIHRGALEPNFEIPTNLVRALTKNLAAQQQYDVALEVTNLSHNILSSMPAAIEKLDEDKRLVERLIVDAKMKPLEDFIDGFESDFGLLSQALKTSGFGPKSTGPARDLWEQFVKVAEVTDREQSTDSWMLIRDLANHLNHNVEDPKAASALINGLIHHGEKVSAVPTLLGRLREDLRLINAARAPAKSRPTTTLRKRPTKARRKRKATRKGIVWPAGLALLAFGAFILYLGFDEGYWPRWKSFAKTLISSTATDVEIEPPVGTGQHFSLGNVRYCHFQEERLRIMKENVRSAEDTRAFNMLVVDYNSRCSDFFFQDSDVATVKAEIAANRQRLADQAQRIMSTWPGHTPVPVLAPPAN